MKRRHAVVLILLLMCVLCTGCAIRKTAKGKNVKVDYTGTATVSFYPVCPQCDHVSPRCTANISDGEHAQRTYICEKCNEVYMISIDRR